MEQAHGVATGLAKAVTILSLFAAMADHAAAYRGAGGENTHTDRGAGAASELEAVDAVTERYR